MKNVVRCTSAASKAAALLKINTIDYIRLDLTRSDVMFAMPPVARLFEGVDQKIKDKDTMYD